MHLRVCRIRLGVVMLLPPGTRGRDSNSTGSCAPARDRGHGGPRPDVSGRLRRHRRGLVNQVAVARRDPHLGAGLQLADDRPATDRDGRRQPAEIVASLGARGRQPSTPRVSPRARTLVIRLGGSRAHHRRRYHSAGLERAIRNEDVSKNQARAASVRSLASRARRREGAA